MDLGDYIQLAQNGIETAIWVSLPVLAFGLVGGLAVSIFQAATQINDAALAFITKIAASVLALIWFGPFMISRMLEFTENAFSTIIKTVP